MRKHPTILARFTIYRCNSSHRGVVNGTVLIVACSVFMKRDQRSTADVTTPAHEALARDTPQEDAQKSYHTVLEQHIQRAQEAIERPAAGLLLSSFSAGLDIGFGPFLMAVIATLTRDA